jgi:hypothetical protein
LTAVHSTDSEEIDEIKNERIEKEVEDILEQCIFLGLIFLNLVSSFLFLACFCTN